MAGVDDDDDLDKTRLPDDPETLPPLPDSSFGEFDDMDATRMPADPITVLPLSDGMDDGEDEDVPMLSPLESGIGADPMPRQGDAEDRIYETAYAETAFTHDVDPAEVMRAIDADSSAGRKGQSHGRSDRERGGLAIALIVVLALLVTAGVAFWLLGDAETTPDSSDPPDSNDPPAHVDPPSDTNPPPRDGTDANPPETGPDVPEDVVADEPDVVPEVVAPTFGGLEISSEPSGAQVFVDGGLRGTTPLSLERLPIGDHEVRVELRFHDKWDGTQKIDGGKSAQLSASLVRATSTLKLTDGPPGATVVLRRDGSSPREYRESLDAAGALIDWKVESGEYTLEVTHEGYLPRRASVVLERDVTVERVVDLQKEVDERTRWPQLSVQRLDFGERVFRDGVEIRPSGRTAPGTFELELRRDGYAPQTVTVTAKIGEILYAEAADWSAYQAVLDPTSVGAGVSVLVNGELVTERVTFAQATTVEVVLQRKGCKPQTQNLKLPLGKPHVIVAGDWEELFGTLVLNNSPAGVIATIDGKTLRDGDSLTPNTYTVQFSRDGYLPQSAQLVVNAGASVTVQFPEASSWQPVPVTTERMNELLTRRARWNAATDDERRQTIDAVAAKNRAFTFDGIERFECGGAANFVALFTHTATKTKFALLPGGGFQIGQAGIENAPPGAVTLSAPFFIATHEVTQRLWKSGKRDNPSDHVGDDLPVESVDWYQAKKFCEDYGWSLPTEAQWEYACRGGTTSLHSFESGAADAHAWHFTNSGPETHHVGGKLPNAFGLYDMHGNVREWCIDVHLAYPSAPRTDPIGTAERGERVIRGGSCRSKISGLASALRDREEPRGYSKSLGLRPVAPVVLP